MAHIEPIYRPPKASEAATTFAEIAERGNGLHIGCWECQRSEHRTGAALIGAYGTDCAVIALFERLVCKVDASRPARVYVIGMGANRHPGPTLDR